MAFSHMWCTGMMNMAYAKHWCAIISTMDVDLVREAGRPSNMLPATNVQRTLSSAAIRQAQWLTDRFLPQSLFTKSCADM